MLPVQVENQRMPPTQNPKEVQVEDGKINFLQSLHPFIQLLLAIGNAVFLPSFFVFSDLLKKLSPTHKTFFQTVKVPGVIPTEPEQIELEHKEELQNSFASRLRGLEERLFELEQRFKQEHTIVEDMKELEKLNIDLSGTLDELKNSPLNENGEKLTPKEIADYKTSTQRLHDQLDDFCVREGMNLFSRFHRVFGIFSKASVDLPDDMREELQQTWKALENSLRPHLTHLKAADVSRKLTAKLDEMKKLMQGLSKNVKAQKHTHEVREPLKLRNIGNSCYMDSVLQALACVDTICKDFSQPIPPADFLKDRDAAAKKTAIQQEILPFLSARQINSENKISKIGYVLYLLEGPSSFRLREAIFKSGFNMDLTMPTLKDQHDAAVVMGLFIDRFLPNCRFKTKEYTSTKDFPGLEFPGRVEDRTMLEIPLRPAPYEDLVSLIHWVMHKRKEREPNPKDQRLFDPKDGIIIDEEEGSKCKKESPKKVEEYIQWRRFTELPAALVLQFQRSIFVREKPDEPLIEQKDDRPAELPSDGIIDLSKYYDAPKDASKQAKYKIKSYVAHTGESVHLGHYVTYVEINGKYYYCNDLDAAPKEITKQEFFKRKDAYMIVLERLPDEEAPMPLAAGG